MAYKTFTGIDAKEIPAALAKIFEDTKAYKGVPGGADLTDINTGHMIERITEVFGPKGLGWNFVFQPEHMEIVNPLDKRVLARLKFAIFKYLIVKDDGQEVWIEIPTSGANTNELAYAEEGARTSALGAAIKGLCFQLPIYKGLLDHHNAATEISKSKAAKAKAEGSAPAAGSTATTSAPSNGEKAPEAKAAPSAAKKDEATIMKELGFAPKEQAPAPSASVAPAPSQPAEAVAEPAPPVLAEQAREAGASTGNFIITIGSKHKGKRLADLSEQALAWYAGELAPTSDAGRQVQAQAKAYLAELAAVKA